MLFFIVFVFVFVNVFVRSFRFRQRFRFLNRAKIVKFLVLAKFYDNNLLIL
jgi:hypothetical protein